MRQDAINQLISQSINQWLRIRICSWFLKAVQGGSASAPASSRPWRQNPLDADFTRVMEASTQISNESLGILTMSARPESLWESSKRGLHEAMIID